VYFTDLINDRILRFVLRGKRASDGGRFEVFRSPAGRANGLAFDRQGRLLACEGAEEGGHRRVTRTEKDGTITVLADQYQGKRLNSPNDVDTDAQGRVYFTDPRYTDRSDMELDHESVYRVDPDGALVRIIDDVVRPNGLAVSADQKTLYVVDNDNTTPGGTRKIYAYELRPDGSTGARRVFHDFGTGRGGDGMTLDELGNVYIAAGLNTAAPPAEDDSVPAGVYVFSPQGEQLGVLRLPQDMITNVGFGDTDLRTLYITCGGTLFFARLKVRGYVLWPSPEE
jgi:gluconolactonase